MSRMWIVPISTLIGVLAYRVARRVADQFDQALQTARSQGLFETCRVDVITCPSVVMVGLVAFTTCWWLERNGLGVEGLVYAASATLLWLMAYVDGRTGILPDAMTGIYLWIAIGCQISLAPDHLPDQTHCITTLAAYLVPFLINMMFQKCRGIDALGIGDAKLMAGLAMWFGPLALGIILLDAIRGFLCFAVLKFLTGRGFPKALPLGPFLAMSGNVWMLMHV